MLLSLVGLAPWTFSSTLPSRKTMNVGSAETPYSAATSPRLSLLTLTKVTRLGTERDFESCSYTGAICLQGPHQSA